MNYKFLLFATLTFGLLTTELANAQTEETRTDGVYWALAVNAPPTTLVLVFDGTKVQQFYEYGRWFGEQPTEQGKYSTVKSPQSHFEEDSEISSLLSVLFHQQTRIQQRLMMFGVITKHG